MDTAVALVQAYLHLNGYFTVVEFPVLESFRAAPARTVSDLEVLAFRFPRSHADVIRRQRGQKVVEGGEADAVLDDVEQFVVLKILGCRQSHIWRSGIEIATHLSVSPLPSFA